MAHSLPPAVGGPLEAAAKGAYVSAMSVSLVAAAVVAAAAAVMVRRFYPDRIVPHEGQGHAPVGAPAPMAIDRADGSGNGDGHGAAVDGLRPLEGSGRER